jgi:hypothetical protein
MMTEMAVVTMGGGFPWGLLIIGGILYLLWRNGMFDGRGRHGGYGPGYGPGPGQGGPGFRGPREYFDEWHRQAHEAGAQPQAQAPVAPAAPAAPQAPAAPAAQAPQAPAAGNGETAS